MNIEASVDQENVVESLNGSTGENETQGSNGSTASSWRDTDVERIREREWAAYGRMVQKRSEWQMFLLEVAFWLALLGLFAYFYYRSITYSNGSKFYTPNFFILLGAFVVVSPILFKLIFGKTPLAYLREARLEQLRRREMMRPIGLRKEEAQLESLKRINEELSQDLPLPPVSQVLEKLTPVQEKATVNLKELVRKAEVTARNIYNRAGVYLFVGCLIAFGGVMIFYSQTSELTERLTKLLEEGKLTTAGALVEYAPRIGTLIFVEAIAFFFLRQYRTNMDEFRYYEGLKRMREDQDVMIDTMNKTVENAIPLSDVIQIFNHRSDKLAPNETTELLEAKKLQNSEADILDKIVDVIKVSKR